MHIGHRNQKYDYTLNNITLTETTEEKDLGVYVTPNLKSAIHVSKVAAKANSVLGWISRTFTYMDKTMFMSLYLSLVRSHIEHAVKPGLPN